MSRNFKLYVIFAVALTSCQVNMLQDVSSKTSSEAMYEDAVKLMDQMLFDDAYLKISLIEVADNAFSATNQFKKTKAGIQAGQCGLTFISLIEGLTQATGGNTFKMLMEAFKGTSVNPTKCMEAQTTIESLGTVDDDQLLFMAILGMTKVGTNLRDKADRDGTAQLGDGAEDAGFDICDSSAAINHLTDDDLKQVITGLGLTLQNFVLIGGSFAGSGAANSMRDLQQFCDDPAGDGTGVGLDADRIECKLTDKDSTALTPALIRAFRRVIKTQDQGIGAIMPGCNLNPMDPAYCCPGLATP